MRLAHSNRNLQRVPPVVATAIRLLARLDARDEIEHRAGVAAVAGGRQGEDVLGRLRPAPFQAGFDCLVKLDLLRVGDGTQHPLRADDLDLPVCPAARGHTHEALHAIVIMQVAVPLQVYVAGRCFVALHVPEHPLHAPFGEPIDRGQQMAPVVGDAGLPESDHLEQIAQLPLVNQLAHPVVHGTPSAGTADGERDTRSLACCDHIVRLGQRDGDRFLGPDRLEAAWGADLHGIEQDARPWLGGRADTQDVWLLPLQHLPVVGVERLDAPFPAVRLALPLMRVGASEHLHAAGPIAGRVGVGPRRAIPRAFLVVEGAAHAP